MTGPGSPIPEDVSESKIPRAAEELLDFAYRRNIEGVQQAVRQGADVNWISPESKLSALHIAVGNNDITLCRYLVEKCGARFFPDGFGRWPTLVAAECRVDDDLSDYIAEQEARFMQRNRSA